MNNELILDILYQVLGAGKKTSRDNYAFKCPNGCHSIKHKLEVNINSYQYQCWICGDTENGFKGNSLLKLLKQSKASKNKIDRLRPLLKSNKSENYSKTNDIVELPKEFQTFDNNNDIIAKHAFLYLKKRGITKNDIIKYNIGYCSDGLYKNMIIIPTYDKDGNINYFTARSFEKDPFIKYKNPNIDRNIIPNEHLINWDLPIILCEGLFDAISIKRNVIPLLGKNIQSNLMKKLVESKIKKIYIALDSDALKQSIKHCELLLNENKEVYLINTKEKDPNELGFNKFTKIIHKVHPLTFTELLKIKLSL